MGRSRVRKGALCQDSKGGFPVGKAALFLEKQGKRRREKPLEGPKNLEKSAKCRYTFSKKSGIIILLKRKQNRKGKR